MVKKNANCWANLPGIVDRIVVGFAFHFTSKRYPVYFAWKLILPRDSFRAPELGYKTNLPDLPRFFHHPQ